MRLSDLLLGGGFYDAAYLSNVFRARADIIRIEEDYISKEIISFSLNDIINDPNSPENILLKAGDAVTIYDASFLDMVILFQLKERLPSLVSMN